MRRELSAGFFCNMTSHPSYMSSWLARTDYPKGRLCPSSAFNETVESFFVFHGFVLFDVAGDTSLPFVCFAQAPRPGSATSCWFRFASYSKMPVDQLCGCSS